MLHAPLKNASRSDTFAILPFKSDKKTAFVNQKNETIRGGNITTRWLSAIMGPVERGTPAENAEQMLVNLGIVPFNLEHVASIASTDEAPLATTHLFLARIDGSTNITSAETQSKLHGCAYKEMKIHEIATMINTNMINDGIMFILFQNLQIYYPNLI
jgi:hypothetical protein